AVLRDVEDGFVSTEMAEKLYGVVLGESGIDEMATAERRRALAGANEAGGNEAGERFSYGPAREEFESVWTDSLQRMVNEATEGIPPSIREHVRAELIDGMENGGIDLARADLASLRGRVAEILEGLKPSGNSS
ncbi:MAG: hypothetical protein V3V56_04390, partial [bacterium]